MFSVVVVRRRPGLANTQAGVEEIHMVRVTVAGEGASLGRAIARYL